MKKTVVLVLLRLASLCMVESCDSEIIKAMRDCKMIPDGMTGSVLELLKVTFENNVTANLGNEITPFQTRNPPALDWNADENSFYTILNLCPDAPYKNDPFFALLNTWMVGNIPGKDIKAGEVLFEYLAAATPKGAGLNRYAILVYRQPGKLKFNEQRIDKFHFQGRSKFPLREFESKYGLGRPVAANFYRTQFDPYVLVVFNELQCCMELNLF